MTNYIQTKNGKTTDGKKGGIFKGVRHSSPEGGIPIVIDGGGSALVEDSEPIIIPEAVNNPKKHLFDGKQMTSKEILSEINTRYKGVPIKKKGGLLKKEKGGFVNKKAIPVKSGSVIITRNAALDNKTKHNFNGEQLTNKEVLSKINEEGGGVSFGGGGKLKTTIDEQVYGLLKEYKTISKPFIIDKLSEILNTYTDDEQVNWLKSKNAYPDVNKIYTYLNKLHKEIWATDKDILKDKELIDNYKFEMMKSKALSAYDRMEEMGYENGDLLPDCGCHEKGGTIEDMVICQNCGWTWNIKDKEPNTETIYLCDACTHDNLKYYK